MVPRGQAKPDRVLSRATGLRQEALLLMSTFVRESVTVGGKSITFETGRLAKQAHGSILITLGETVVLVTAVCSEERPGLDFFPLTCDYIEKTYAAGKIPGGFFKREARQRDDEILTSRLIGGGACLAG